jgi:CSLREA domain-containing protein
MTPLVVGSMYILMMYATRASRISGLLALGCWLAVPSLACADVIILVDTVADVVANDGACSLREAITAANNNGNYFGCIGSGGGFDLIEFGIGAGTPVITLASPLPVITGPVEINGGTNRVEVRGPGSGAGLKVSGALAAGSVLRGLVLNGFAEGISLDTTSNIKIGHNYIGTNAGGTAAAANSTGILLSNSTAQIGGTTGLTADGPCTGDCNLISGNTLYGIRLSSGASATLQGNFIGTDAAGTAALGNGSGIRLESGFATVGGIAAGAGNLISGNSRGIYLQVTAASALGTVIQGNRIGSNAAGTGAVANGDGILADLGNKRYPLSIGGGGAGTGNLISGNANAGILLTRADYVAIYDNRIGTQANGSSPLPNGGDGVQLTGSTHDNVIGGIGPGEANVIAYNNAAGVTIGINNYWNRVRGNSIHDNTGKGINLPDYQNDGAFAPLISGVGPVTGTACADCIVDVYSDAADEGLTYEGTATADGAGNWTYGVAIAGPNVTATATNAGGSTSEFSVPFPAQPDTDGDGVPDATDNCQLRANAGQCDSDSDGYGNQCDGDFNNNGFTNSQDYILFRAQLGQPSAGPTYTQADLNCNGFVNSQDYILFRALLGQPSGPSGLH